MTYESILVDVADGIVKITLNRPEALNALTLDMLKELRSAIDEAAKDKEIGVILLKGSGRSFCAGLDLIDISSRSGPDTGKIINAAARELQSAIEAAPKAVIAMVHGHCITGGLEIALACDMIIAADDTKLGDTHTRWGLRCTWGMSQRLPFRVGEIKARELTFTADLISGREAERIGLINKAVPAADLEDTVLEMVGKILSNSLESVVAHKFLYNQGRKDAIGRGLEREYTTQAEISDTMDRIMGFAAK